jgi:predicted permease
MDKMDAIIGLWWVTLIIAYALLIPVLALVTRFIRHAREVDRLARVTLTAAVGVAGNTANIPLLDTLLAKAGSIAATSAAIDGVAAAIHADAVAVVTTLQGGGQRG